MQVLSRQRAIPLVEVRKPESAGSFGHGCMAGRSPGSGSAQAKAPRHLRGFTLVELMITLAIALVLIMIAVPSFQRITASSKLTTVANEMVGSINVARMEAVKRNASTQFCGNVNAGGGTLDGACAAQTGAVYVLINNKAERVRAGTNGISGSIVLTGNVTPVVFGGQGLGHTVGSTAPYTGLIADISTTSISTDNHRCINMTAGSIIVTTTLSAACPTS